MPNGIELKFEELMLVPPLSHLPNSSEKSAIVTYTSFWTWIRQCISGLRDS